MNWRHFGAAGLVVVASVTAAAWFVAPTGGIDPSDASQVALGRAIYADHCASCHGVNLEGQPDWRTRKADGRMPAPPHDASGHTWHHPDEQLIEMTKKGASGIVPGYQSDMPGFEGILSDREIEAVLSYIKSTWPAEIRRRQEGR
ncbi:mono/diheme cytochrome c family protein [Constrictibacter sp. MBR-5]|uniref:c-type cytochrome n=1 Tax=Constrictibacter sp. MBR-5 TaxID=3156467 RepID=UPI0033946153